MLLVVQHVVYTTGRSEWSFGANNGGDVVKLFSAAGRH